jgi:hypothetical protein
MSTKLTVKKTITDLFAGNINAVPLEQLNTILNTPPPAEWVKTHPFIKGHNYLPIDKVEYLLKKCFKQYRIEVIKTGMLMNAVEVTVRVHYLNPVTGTLDYHDGVAAQELQTVSGTGALKMDMSNVSRGAVAMALPIAKSLAVKDACDHLGELFGANLNRKEALHFEPDQRLLASDVAMQKEQDRIKAFIESATDKTALTTAMQNVTMNEELQELLTNKLNTL